MASLIIIAALFIEPAFAAADHSPKPAAKAAVAKQPVLTFHLAWLEQRETLKFSNTGQPQKPMYRLKLKFVAPYHGSATVRSFTFLGLDKLITGDGHSLYVKPSDPLYVWHLDQGAVQYTISALSPTFVKSIRTIQGRVQLHLPTAPAWKAVLSPVSQYLGQKVWIPNLGKKAWILVTRDDSKAHKHKVDITLSHQAFHKFKNLDFADSHGRHIEWHFYECGCSGPTDYRNARYKYFVVTLPDDGKVVMYFWPKLKAVTVPFTISNVKLPMPRSSAASSSGVVTIQTQQVPGQSGQAGPATGGGPVLHTDHGQLRGGGGKHPPEAPR